MILHADNVTKTYVTGSAELTILDRVSFELEERATCAIVGPSGSGKTTLLGLCAGLDRPTAGSVTLCNSRLGALGEDELAQLRSRMVGFVFQTFRLIPTLTALENVMVPLELMRLSGGADGNGSPHRSAAELLDRVGLGARLRHYPAQLSGGEQQRVALARAFVHRPAILFADEPTGNLDTETSAAIIELLFQLNRDRGTALVLVTHDTELAQRTGHIMRLRGGRVVADERVDTASR